MKSCSVSGCMQPVARGCHCRCLFHTVDKDMTQLCPDCAAEGVDRWISKYAHKCIKHSRPGPQPLKMGSDEQRARWSEIQKSIQTQKAALNREAELREILDIYTRDTSGEIKPPDIARIRTQIAQIEAAK